jgi:hypothetical protein
MPPRIPLPPRIDARPFTIAEALRLGVTRDRLRGPDLEAPFEGVRIPPGFAERDPYLRRIAGCALLLRPGDRFSHTTAATIWPLPLPVRAAAIHVTSPRGRNAPRIAGVRGHERDTTAPWIRHGHPVPEPAEILLELATLLEHDDLVAVGDALVHDPEILDPDDPRPWITLSELRARISAARGPGSASARRALRDVRIGAESRPETLLRLLLVRAGLPEPELNQVLLDAHDRRLGRFDLVYRAQRVIVEYDGDQHRTSTAQYEHDIRRLERAREEGWQTVQVRSKALFGEPAEVIARARRAMALGSRRRSP